MNPGSRSMFANGIRRVSSKNCQAIGDGRTAGRSSAPGKRPFTPRLITPCRMLRLLVSEGTTHRLRYVPTIGVEASGNVNWWGDFPWDQRGTDAYSLVYDSDLLEHDLEILGFPRAVLHVSADAPLANWIVRVSDIAPDGTVTQVAGAGMSGAQRGSSEEPESLVPGQPFKLEYDLAFHVVGVSQGAPDPARSEQRPVADDLAHAPRDDHDPGRGRRDRIACGAAGHPRIRPGRT